MSYVVIHYPPGSRWPDLETDYLIETYDEALALAHDAREELTERGLKGSFAIGEVTVLGDPS